MTTADQVYTTIGHFPAWRLRYGF